jgi:hypothetical protein
MTGLYVVLSVFPIIRVASIATFATKISLLILAANAVGAFIFISARRRRAAR